MSSREHAISGSNNLHQIPLVGSPFNLKDYELRGEKMTMQTAVIKETQRVFNDQLLDPNLSVEIHCTSKNKPNLLASSGIPDGSLPWESMQASHIDGECSDADWHLHNSVIFNLSNTPSKLFVYVGSHLLDPEVAEQRLLEKKLDGGRLLSIPPGYAVVFCKRLVHSGWSYDLTHTIPDRQL
jgi:hypothetical protein